MVWLLVNEAKGKRPRPRKDVKNYTANIPIRTLPPELERDIFEMAVQQYPKDAAKMARVARRVQDWCVAFFISITSRCSYAFRIPQG